MMKSLSRVTSCSLVAIVFVVLVALLFCFSFVTRASSARPLTSTRMCSSCVPSPLNIMYSFYRLIRRLVVGFWMALFRVGDLFFGFGDGEVFLMVEHKKERWEKGGRGTF